MLKHLTGMMQRITQELLSRWQMAALNREPVNVSQAMSAFGLEVVLRGLFSDDMDRLIDEHGGNPFSIFTDDSARDLNLAVKFRALIKLIQGVIDRRRERQAGTVDMLAALMASRDLQGRPMSDKALIDELMTLIVAGHETSAVNLTWMWHLLGHYPAVEALLHAEVDNLPYAQSPGFSDLPGLEYAKQIMFETMRLYPPVWLFSRKALQEDWVPGGHIPAGSDIFISPYFLHRRDDFWPDPERFEPQRFTEAETEHRHRTAYIPFSAGPRKCIGDVFSTVEMQIHFGTIARKLRLRPAPEQKIELEPAINLRSKHHIIMIPELR
jgi:cytochrome P450